MWSLYSPSICFLGSRDLSQLIILAKKTPSAILPSVPSPPPHGLRYPKLALNLRTLNADFSASPLTCWCHRCAQVCWCHRCALLALGYLVMETEPRASPMLTQHSTNGASALSVHCSFIHCPSVKTETPSSLVLLLGSDANPSGVVSRKETQVVGWKLQFSGQDTQEKPLWLLRTLGWFWV